MAQLLHEIEWGSPILPSHTIPEWESEAKATLGTVPDILKRAAPNTWLRKALLDSLAYQAVECPRDLCDIVALVTAQENACRYCYGVARAQMRLFGYSEKMISSIERDRHLAELDEKSHAFVRFCRALSRSRPRPSRADCDQLVSLGFSPVTVAEMAFLISSACFVNRVSTFVAAPPEQFLERLPSSFLGRALRPILAWKFRRMGTPAPPPLEGDAQTFPPVVRALRDLGAARVVRDALEGCFGSEILSPELKVLMFAVIARSLQCTLCETESRSMADDLGIGDDAFEAALRTLSPARLSESEQRLLAWSRETTHYQIGPIQRRVRELADEVGEDVILEAVGVAALANTTVRLAALIA